MGPSQSPSCSSLPSVTGGRVYQVTDVIYPGMTLSTVAVVAAVALATSGPPGPERVA